MLRMAPSILSADLLDIKSQVLRVAEHGADLIHIDVMDGHFVPNLTFGSNMVEALKRVASVPLDVHLMITNAEDCLKSYIDAGADIVTLHWEAVRHMHRALQQIHALGKKAGVSLNPATPVAVLEDVIEELDMVLIMTVNPGFGGQKFIEHGIEKIRAVRKMAEQRKPELWIEVDGGINQQTAPLVTAAGADVLVAGSAVFGQSDPSAAMQAIRVAGMQTR